MPATAHNSTHTLPVQIDKGSGTPLVLLHGIGNNYNSWQTALEHLDYTKWRVVALDLLGFGDAPKPNVKYTPQDHADAVVATLDKLGITQAALVGHSMGCIVAIEIAHRYPERALQLVLIGAPLYSQAPRSDRWGRLTRSGGAYFKLFTAVKDSPDIMQAGSDIASGLIAKGMEITSETWPAYKKSLQHTLMQYKSYKHAGALSVPTLFMCGYFDYFIIRSNIRRVKRSNRRYTTTKFTIGSHGLSKYQGKAAAKLINNLIIGT